MSERNEARLRLAADSAALARAAAFIEGFLKERKVARDDIGRVLVAVEELVTNIVKYGYPASERGIAEIVLRLTGNALAVAVEDDGQAFDPLTAPVPDLDAPLEERRAGGLGLLLVKSLMERTAYRRVDGRNIVEIERHVAFES